MINRFRKGFTLLEPLIVLTLMIIVSVLAHDWYYKKTLEEMQKQGIEGTPMSGLELIGWIFLFGVVISIIADFLDKYNDSKRQERRDLVENTNSNISNVKDIKLFIEHFAKVYSVDSNYKNYTSFYKIGNDFKIEAHKDYHNSVYIQVPWKEEFREADIDIYEIDESINPEKPFQTCKSTKKSIETALIIYLCEYFKVPTNFVCNINEKTTIEDIVIGDFNDTYWELPPFLCDLEEEADMELNDDNNNIYEIVDAIYQEKTKTTNFGIEYHI